MNKIIRSNALIAYLQCKRKAFLLLCTDVKGIPNEYEEIIRKQKMATRDRYIAAIKQSGSDIQLYSINNMKSGSDLLINATLQMDGAEADCDILQKVKVYSSLGRYSYEPIIVIGTCNISKEQDELALYFAGYVLGHMQGSVPVFGTIVNMRGEPRRLKLEKSAKIFTAAINSLREWVASLTIEPPPIILNKHCFYCQFQNLCKNEAELKDNLSLLKGVTPKIMKKYEKKGIFTVKQLSYLFKPRKYNKKRIKRALLHSLELQALAIRTNKVYIQELPEISRQPTELFLDIEGIPDQDAYYLIGLLVCNSDKYKHYSYWADSLKDESQIWQQFLEKAREYPEAPIYHYGSYELKAIEKLRDRYNTDFQNIESRLLNINSCIYGKVYFPVTVNSLKQIGKFVGASWTIPNSSGLQSLVWRYYWDTDKDIKYNEFLLTYNREDCYALKLLTDELTKIKEQAASLPYIDFAHNPKQHITDIAAQLHNQFDSILKFSHADYNKKKISFLQNENNNIDKKLGAKKGHQGFSKIIPKAKIVIHIPRMKKCPKHRRETLRASNQISKRTIIDLVFGKTGVRKKVTKYIGEKGYCLKCQSYYSPQEIRTLEKGQIYGHSFRVWIIYLRLCLRLAYSTIVQVSEDLFKEKISKSITTSVTRDFAAYYSETNAILIQRMLASPFIHIDETKINMRGVNQNVWVFTDGKHVIFKLTATREANIVHEILADYKGVLISDFYGGYDSVKCKQQKCWSHLIRDINDDLWEAPFDSEYEIFVMEVRNLIIPLLESVQRYGSRKVHFNKFRRNIDRFYGRVIDGKIYKSELVLKYQKRFIRYRESLFTFLEFDGIPWNNNMAERAIRHLALQRKISLSFFESVTHQYLLLLGIAQTCRFQGKSLLKFLLSGKKDIDQFKKPRSIRKSRPTERLKAQETFNY